MFRGLISAGLLARGGTDRYYSITELGHAYCHALQLTPIPVVQWVIPAQPEKPITDLPIRWEPKS
jgi:DNA-binding PadR family transcriptional regulator